MEFLLHIKEQISHTNLLIQRYIFDDISQHLIVLVP